MAVKGTAPLRDGIEIALILADGTKATISRRAGTTHVTAGAPPRPDMTFTLGAKSVEPLLAIQSDDVGEIGVEILKLLAHEDPDYRLKAKVHIGPFDLFRHGYLNVLPLGGPTVMKFLASKGFTGLGKIKDAISSLRD